MKKITIRLTLLIVCALFFNKAFAQNVRPNPVVKKEATTETKHTPENTKNATNTKKNTTEYSEKKQYDQTVYTPFCYMGDYSEGPTPESVINDQAEDTTVYKVTKFVIPKYSENVNIYKSPSKASQILVFKVCMDDGEDNCGFLKWTKTKSEVEINVIPASKDSIFGYYNVNVLIGFISKEDCVDAVVSNVSISDVQNDSKVLDFFYSRGNNYVKWGLMYYGFVMYIGKIVDGKALESEELTYSPDSIYSFPKKLVVANDNKEYVFTNKKYFHKDQCGDYDADFSKFSNEDFNKVLSLSDNKYPYRYIKIRGITKLYLIRDDDVVDGRKIVWNY